MVRGGRMVLQLLAVTLLIRYSEGRSACSSSKLLPKYTEAFSNLQEEDMVLEAKFISKEKVGYRFEIIQTWSLNNGQLNSMDRIRVTIDSETDTSVTMCFDELSSKQSYLLLLRRSGEAFVPQIASFPLKKNPRRDEIRQAWCDIPESDCALKISRYHLEPIFELYPGSSVVMHCKVDSKSDLTAIRWLKDGIDIEADGGEVYAQYGVYVYASNLRSRSSKLVIDNYNSLLSGLYSCVASNVEGETTTLSTRVVVDSEPSAFGECPTWAVNYCHESSVCRSIVDLPNEVMCECKPGHSGRRCHEVASPDIGMVSNETKLTELNRKIQQLRVTTVVLAIALAISILILIYLIARNIKQRRRRRLPSNFDSQSDMKKSADSERGEL